MPIELSRGRDDDVAAAEQGGVAGEAAAGDDADQRHPAAQAREAGEGRDVQAGDDRHVDVARPAAAAFGEQHHRQPLLRARSPSRRSVFWWLRMPCVPASTVAS